MSDARPLKSWLSSSPLRAFLSIAAVGAAFALFAARVADNPPGYYVDESALSYNAYLVSQAGAGETGEKLPLFFPVYQAPFTQYANPTQIYLLALLFKMTGPSITAARSLAAACVFAACLLLGLLARKITGRNAIGIAVAGLALTTPWFFEMGRIVLETFCYPLAVVLLLWSVFRASRKEIWTWADRFAIVVPLALVTYSYTIGRLLGPLLAVGLLCFVTGRKRLLSLFWVWGLYFVSLIPFLTYWSQTPELSARFGTLSYLKKTASVTAAAAQFVSRYVEDLNPFTMLLVGDTNPRHHLPDALGSFLIGTFILSLIGFAVILVYHRRDRWWLYVVFGLLASAVPGALTVDPFHTLRMAAYPVFLLALTIPALAWLLGGTRPAAEASAPAAGSWRVPAAAAIFGLAAAQAGFFFYKYHATGTDRAEYFDAAYRTVYDAAVSLPDRPIYLVDGYWGPMYVHAFWYATLEKRELSDFVHLPYGRRAPAGSIVLSSERACSGCVPLLSEGDFILYRTLGAGDPPDTR